MIERVTEIARSMADRPGALLPVLHAVQDEFGYVAPGVGEQPFEGLGVSPGIAIGPAFLREAGAIKVLEYRVPAKGLGEQKERFAKLCK